MRNFFAPSNKVSPENQSDLNNNGEAGAASTQINTDDANNLTLIEAASKGDIANVERLLRDSNERVKINSTNELGATALMLASYSNYPEIVEKLIEAGADVNLATEKEGTTALMEASDRGHFGVVEKLINAKADVDLTTKAGVTALMIASQMGHSNVVDQLINAKANVDLATKARITALMLASDLWGILGSLDN